MKYEHVRTLSIVRELAQGKTIVLDGYTFAMGEDMTIGVVMTGSDGSHIGGLSTVDLAQLNRLLNKNGIGMVISK